jgi:hypothetical protein
VRRQAFAYENISAVSVADNFLDSAACHTLPFERCCHNQNSPLPPLRIMAAQQLRQLGDIRRNPPRLILAEQLRCQPPPGSSS